MDAHRPRIAVPVPTTGNDAYNQRCWPQYAAALVAAGGEAVEIPLTLSPAETAKVVSTCSAVLLPGSPADVHPQKYGEEALPETAAPDASREATDELLLQDAFHLRKPLLGVCFGMQMMNVWRGGSLVQHLATGYPHAPNSGSPPLTHPAAIAADAALLQGFFRGEREPVINSSHHQAVLRAGDGLAVAARSQPDGVVEALESTEPGQQWALGVQWHPERSYETDHASAAIFAALVAAARRWRLPYA